MTLVEFCMGKYKKFGSQPKKVFKKIELNEVFPSEYQRCTN